MIQTIKDWIASVLGTYTPVTYTVRLVDADGASVGSYQAVAEGLAGVDWEYIFTAIFLLIVVYSVFRLLGVLLSKISGGSAW